MIHKNNLYLVKCLKNMNIYMAKPPLILGHTIIKPLQDFQKFSDMDPKMSEDVSLAILKVN